MSKTMRVISSLLLFFTMCALCACHYESIKLDSSVGTIEFTGNYQNAQFYVDDKGPVTIKYETVKTETGAEQVQMAPRTYKLSEGQHRIKVYNKDSVLMVDRIIFIKSQMQQEVFIP